ncbi:MAG TPA: response regulator [bacterium]|nr:response regulator [bacterium]HPV65088.1 response regulator [bacterium]
MKLTKKILLVEDEKCLAEAVKIKLEINGFQVLPADSVDRAKDLINKNSVDFVWLDHYLLGEENGLDFVANIKSQDSTNKNIPIFVVSNTASNDKIQSYIKFGINKYYVKAEHSLEQIIGDLKTVLK